MTDAGIQGRIPDVEVHEWRPWSWMRWLPWTILAALVVALSVTVLALVLLLTDLGDGRGVPSPDLRIALWVISLLLICLGVTVRITGERFVVSEDGLFQRDPLRSWTIPWSELDRLEIRRRRYMRRLIAVTRSGQELSITVPFRSPLLAFRSARLPNHERLLAAIDSFAPGVTEPLRPRPSGTDGTWADPLS